MSFVDKLFGNKSEKEIKRIEKYVDAIEALDEKMQALSDEELRAKTQEFKDRLAAGETLDDLLVEAFAVVREGSRPYDPSEALSCAADGWYYFTSGSYCRDEDW